MLEAVKTNMKIIKTVNQYLSLFTVGLSISLAGPCLLDLQKIVDTDTEHIAFIFTSRSIGFLVGAILGGILLDVVKSKQAVLTACNLFVAATMFAIPWSRSVETLMGFMVVNGISLGAIETGANVVCLQLWGSGPFLQALHFTFGLGGLISPLIASPFLSNQKEPEYITNNATSTTIFNATSNLPNDTHFEGVANITYPFSIVGVFALVVTFLFFVVCLISPTEEPRPKGSVESNSNRSFLFMFGTIIFTFFLFFVVTGVEIGYGQTLTTYAVKGSLHVSTAVGSYITSAYWAAFTLSRLVSVFLAMKVKNMTLVISDICIIGVSALMLLFLMPHEWTLWSASVIFGVGIASCYAALIGWIDTHIKLTNKLSSVFIVGCAAGEMVVPFIIAYFMESVPEMFAYVTAASCVLIVILLLILLTIFKTGKGKCPSKETKLVECYIISSGVVPGDAILEKKSILLNPAFTPPEPYLPEKVV